MNEVTKRIVFGLIWAAAFVFSFNYDGMGQVPLLIFALVGTILGMIEFYRMAAQKNYAPPFLKTGIAAGIFLILLIYIKLLPYSVLAAIRSQSYGVFKFLAYMQNPESTMTVLMGLLFFSMLVIFTMLLLKQQIENSLYSIAVTLMGILYVALPISHIFLLKTIPHGTFYIWFIAFITIASDSMAYASGKLLGRHKIGFKLSPNKTYEGYIGGWIGQLLLTILFYYFVKQYYTVPQISFAMIVVYSLVVYLISIIGDLSESMLKRDVKVKDSGNFVPGHGGILDTLDALLFTIPAFYYTYKFIQVLGN